MPLGALNFTNLRSTANAPFTLGQQVELVGTGDVPVPGGETTGIPMGLLKTGALIIYYVILIVYCLLFVLFYLLRLLSGR